jgi:hypothetical protein
MISDLEALLARVEEDMSSRTESGGSRPSAVKSDGLSGAGGVEYSEVAAAMMGARWVCVRCGRDAADAREHGCSRGPCPMVLTDAR